MLASMTGSEGMAGGTFCAPALKQAPAQNTEANASLEMFFMNTEFIKLCITKISVSFDIC